MSSIAIPGYKLERTLPARRLNLNRFFLFVVAFLLFVLTLELVFHFVAEPKMLISRIEISAPPGFPLSDSQIVEMAGLDRGSYYFSLDSASIARKLDGYPVIQSAKVEKVFPNGVRITLTDRAPFAISLVDSASGTVPIAFDDQGVVIAVGNALANMNLPVISGVAVPQIQIGMQLPHELAAFVHELALVKATAPSLVDAISEIKFVRTSGSDFDVLLYPAAYRVRVRIGSSIDEPLMKYIMMVLDVVSNQGMADKLAELDFRAGQVVYRLKEGG